jgi:hypothetical protein
MATCVFNLLHNLQGLGPSPPTLGANDLIVDLRVINPTFPTTTFKVVMSVVNPTYHIQNLLINKATTTKHIKGPTNNGVGYPFGSQVVKPLDLTRYASGFRNTYLSCAPSNPKWKARVS